MAVIDLLTAFQVSKNSGENYIGQPHDYPPKMLVFSEDVLVAGFDTILGYGGKWSFRIVGGIATLINLVNHLERSNQYV